MIPAKRVGQWLRRKFPAKTSLIVEAEFHIGEATAKRWVSGKSFPREAQFDKMVELWGSKFLRFVYQDALKKRRKAILRRWGERFLLHAGSTRRRL